MHTNIPLSEENNTKAELSVVVLCYRRGKTKVPFLETMEREIRDGGMDSYEIVLVGNYVPGSDDITPAVIRELAQKNPKIVPVTLEKKGMMGWDARSGLDAAHGEAIGIARPSPSFPFSPTLPELFWDSFARVHE